jgi:hypothetical protein
VLGEQRHHLVAAVAGSLGEEVPDLVVLARAASRMPRLGRARA